MPVSAWSTPGEGAVARLGLDVDLLELMRIRAKVLSGEAVAIV